MYISCINVYKPGYTYTYILPVSERCHPIIRFTDLSYIDHLICACCVLNCPPNDLTHV